MGRRSRPVVSQGPPPADPGLPTEMLTVRGQLNMLLQDQRTVVKVDQGQRTADQVDQVRWIGGPEVREVQVE